VSYPVTFEADYIEYHSRLTTFFRLILVIPLAVVLWFYEIAAFFAVRPVPRAPVRIRGGVYPVLDSRHGVRFAAGGPVPAIWRRT
jgi:hypothetical protein